MLFLGNFFYNTLFFQGRGSGLATGITSGSVHPSVLCVVPPTPPSELTLLKVNLALVSADSAL